MWRLDAITWRNRLGVIAMVEACAIVALLIFCMVLYGGVKVLPYVIAIKDGEYIERVGIVPTTADIEQHPGIAYTTLALWLTNTRQITTDPVAWEKLFDQAAAFQTNRASIMLRPFKETQRERLAQGKAVSVEILSIHPIAGTAGRTWELDWRELTVSQMGYPIQEESGLWHMTVKLAQLPPAPITKPGDYINAIRVYVEDYTTPQHRSY